MRAAYTTDDFRKLAMRRLPGPLFDFIDGGSGSERTAQANVDAFRKVKLYHRALVDVSDVDTSTQLFGRRLSMPLFCGPTGLPGLFYPGGELAIAQACAAAGTAYAAPMAAGCSHDDIAASTNGPKILQIAMFKDVTIINALVDAAKAAGYDALCVTVDIVAIGRRYRDFRSGMLIPPKLSLRSALQFARAPAWVWGYLRSGGLSIASLEPYKRGNYSGLSVFEFVNQQMNPSPSWDMFAQIAERWGGPIAAKGIVHPADAKRAVEHGATAVIVSNHGGRQLDGSLPALEALPDVVASVGERAEIILDGGVRSGEDALKALALGADAVSIGRPYLYALAAGGRAGVERLLTILRDEIRTGMALMGCTNTAAITSDLIFNHVAGVKH